MEWLGAVREDGRLPKIKSIETYPIRSALQSIRSIEAAVEAALRGQAVSV